MLKSVKGNDFLQRTLVISDIHGEIDLLEQLLEITKYQPNQDQLILLGDYIDRGPNSRKVLEKVITLKEQGALALMGNHEDLMIKAFTTDEERAWRNWIHRNGGSYTLESYGFKENDYSVSDDVEFIKPTLHSPILEEHLDYIMNLDHFFETDKFIFVHGGVDPSTPVNETDPSELMWIRDAFHKGYTGDKTVIFGHTPTKYLHNDPNNHAIYFGENNIIGIDGAAVYGGQLNCLELPSQKVYSVTKTKKGRIQ